METKTHMILKRDGRRVKFNKQKIIDAVSAAYKEAMNVEEADEYCITKANNIADYVESVCETHKGMLTVEEIQDLVENGLMSWKDKTTAKKYILYRNERTKERNRKDDLMREIGVKINATDVQNQNANIDEYSFGGRKGEAANTLLKNYALTYGMSEMASANHSNNEIYIHDLDSYTLGMHNCLTLPFDDLLANGFNTRQADVRPAGSVNTAFQLVAVIFQLQSLQQFGGVSASHLDWTMVPYVRKSFYKHFKDGLNYVMNYCNYFNLSKEEIKNTSINDKYYTKMDKAYYYAMDMTEREVRQAVEGLYHNLNTLQSRSGNQLPFTSINYGTCTLLEGRMITKCLLEVSIEGLGKLHKTSIFPCGIFQCMEGVNRKPGDPNYDLYQLALKSTAKRLYPNYANVDWSGNAGYDKSDPRTYFNTMGKRKLQLM